MSGKKSSSPTKAPKRRARSSRPKPKSTESARPESRVKTDPRPFIDITRSAVAEAKFGVEAERIMGVMETLLPDLPDGQEASTALLLYALLQTPSTAAHGLLGTLPVDLRARLFREAWHAADIHNGVNIQHIRKSAQFIAEDICQDSIVDSRHLLMACLVGSAFLGRPRELPVGSTATEDILGRSNSAVRAMTFAGLDALSFLNTVRSSRPGVPSVTAGGFPSFFVFLPQPDRVRILRVEEVGEFLYNGPAQRYPSTLGLLDRSIAKPLQPLVELEHLINDPQTPETQLQQFFEAHPEFLLTDEYMAARPGVLLTGHDQFGLKPDFFLARRDSPLWDIAELKLPDEVLVRGRLARRGLAAAVHWGIDQLRRYREYFFDLNAAKLFRDAYGMEVYYPRLTLIIGRDDSFGDYHERQRLTPPEARILTYDDVLRMAKHRSMILPFVQA